MPQFAGPEKQIGGPLARTADRLCSNSVSGEGSELDAGTDAAADGIFREADVGTKAKAAIGDELGADLALLLEDGDTVNLGLPIDDIPKMSLLLALGYAQTSRALALDDLRTTLILDHAEFLDHPNPDKVTLLTRLSTGQPVAFSIDRSEIGALLDQLTALG
jgi:hypothetical protein